MERGIGVSTYNRKESLVRTPEAVRRHTRSNYEFVVSDDGSRDGTAAAVTSLGVHCITGQNMGVGRNKNRLLFYLNNMRHSPLVVMPEVTNVPLNEKTVPESLQAYTDYRDESIHRWAWRADEEMQQFRREMREISIPPLMGRE